MRFEFRRAIGRTGLWFLGLGFLTAWGGLFFRTPWFCAAAGILWVLIGAAFASAFERRQNDELEAWRKKLDPQDPRGGQAAQWQAGQKSLVSLFELSAAQSPAAPAVEPSAPAASGTSPDL